MAAEQFVMLLMLGLGSVVWCQPTTGKCNDGQASNVDEWQLQQTVSQISCDLKSVAEQRIDEKLNNLYQILTTFINQSTSRLSMLELQHYEMQAVMENVSKTQQQLVESVVNIQKQTVEKRGETSQLTGL